MAVGDTYVFPGFLTPVLTQLFFPKPQTTFLTCFCRGERRKYAGKKKLPQPGIKLQPPGYESDTLTTEPPGRGMRKGEIACNEQFFLFSQCFIPFWRIFCHFHQKLELWSANSFSLEESKICHNFSFSYSIFYPVWRTFSNFPQSEIVVCKFFQLGKA